MNSRNTSRFHLGALCVPPDRAGVLEYPLPSEEREGADLLQAIAELKRLPTTECCQWKQIPVFTTPDPMTQSLSADGKCIYCAYDLSGIPPGARCPECGRESLPLAIREEVHAIFDSPRRLYREALRVIARHPPGWYWSLDRETDVRRSFAFAMINVVLCFAIAFGAWFLADSVRIESTTERRLVLRDL